MGWWPCQIEPICNGTVPKQIKGLPEIAGKGTIYAFIILFSLTLLLVVLIVAIDIIDFMRNGWTSFERDYLSNNNTTYIRKILESVVADISKLQWVTGLAILIVGFFRACHLTVYHWNLISYMAILAAVTQTATFIVLSAEWRKYNWVRFARYFGTVCMFLMLAAFIAMKYWTKGWSFDNTGDARWPALCFFHPDQKSPIENPSTKIVWTSLEVFMVPWMAFAFMSIYHELYKKIERQTLRNLLLGSLNFAIPMVISVFSAKKLWLSRESFSDHHYLSDNTEDTWSFGQIVPLVLMLSTIMSLLQSWNKEHIARKERRADGTATKQWPKAEGRSQQTHPSPQSPRYRGSQEYDS